MIDNVSGLQITWATGGWLIAGLFLFGFVTGKWLVSRREADSYLKRAETAEANQDKLLDAVEDFKKTGALVTRLMESLDSALHARSGDSP